MAVEIIKRGVDPRSTQYMHTCENCDTFFEFTGFDSEAVFHAGRNMQKINCPLCKHLCYISNDSGIPDRTQELLNEGE